MIDGGSITSVAALNRNRWPSGETTYCCRARKLLSNSVRKSGTWCAESDLSVRAERHADRCQSLIGSNIEEFRPVSCPAHLLAAARRDLNPTTGAGKRLQVNFEMARFIRLIRDPLAVGRKLAVAFVEGRLHEWVRRAVGTERHIPEVRRRPRGPGVKKNASVRRHVRWVDHRWLSRARLAQACHRSPTVSRCLNYPIGRRSAGRPVTRRD